jgi:putative FmdB family regulatory protein
MPIYEYECGSCGHRFEEWQKMSDKPVSVCPKCNADQVQKLISHTSFQLKGGGWYSDLYSSSKPASGASESGSSTSTSTSASASGDKSTSPSTTSENKGKKGASKAAA